jgi:hypothetical protein
MSLGVGLYGMLGGEDLARYVKEPGKYIHTMYNASKPTESAIRAEKPSYTPGHTKISFEFSRKSRSFVAAEVWSILPMATKGPTFSCVSALGVR